MAQIIWASSDLDYYMPGKKPWDFHWFATQRRRIFKDRDHTRDERYSALCIHYEKSPNEHTTVLLSVIIKVVIAMIIVMIFLLTVIIMFCTNIVFITGGGVGGGSRSCSIFLSISCSSKYFHCHFVSRRRRMALILKHMHFFIYQHFMKERSYEGSHHHLMMLETNTLIHNISGTFKSNLKYN